MSNRTFQWFNDKLAFDGGAEKCASVHSVCGSAAFRSQLSRSIGRLLATLAFAAMGTALIGGQETTAAAAARRANLPPRVAQAERFLARRGWQRNSAGGDGQQWAGAGNVGRRAQTAVAEARAQAQAQAQSGTATWLPLGPAAVQSH
ncbi:MAG: hypothetical protein ABSD72_08680, partial [Terracidiphilus sp.]